MKIIFGFLFVCFFAVTLTAQHHHIQFERGTWQQILDKAKKENKLIYLDCYTTWCGYCMWMEAHVFNNDTAADFFNSHFICAKMDMEKGEGPALAKKYNVKVFPYMLYVNGDGQALHKTCGAASVADFIADAKNALLPQTQLVTYTRLLNSGHYDAATAFKCLTAMDMACLPVKPAAEKYLLTQKDTSLLSAANWSVITMYAGYASPAFKYVERNRAKYEARYGSAAVEKKIEDVYAIELEKAFKNKEKAWFASLKKQFLKQNTTNRESILAHAERRLVKLPEADAINAISIRDSVVGPLNVSLGQGNVNDTELETNSAWFRLDITHDTLLTFDLVPNDSLDDYDFALFRCLTSNCVEQFSTNKSLVSRRCWSYCTSKSGVTGLSAYVKDTAIGPGPGPAYVSGIHVKAGETYYLLVQYANTYVNHNQWPLGFKIYFYNYWPRRVPVILKNIFFENGKAVLRSESFAELDRLADMLNKNQMVIEVRGHTDNQGREKDNEQLSVKRAEAVVNYLKTKNVSPRRLFYKGFGSSQPIAPNDKEEDRQHNRRVEFIVVLN